MPALCCAHVTQHLQPSWEPWVDAAVLLPQEQARQGVDDVQVIRRLTALGRLVLVLILRETQRVGGHLVLCYSICHILRFLVAVSAESVHAGS